MSHRVPESDILNEASVVSSIRGHGGHEHIIEVLDHGWLKGSFKVYYIDMELGSMTLADYIDYFRGANLPTVDIDLLECQPVVSRRCCLLPEKMQNMWIICSHIAKALEFLHYHRYVHRDLKPSNGTAPI